MQTKCVKNKKFLRQVFNEVNRDPRNSFSKLKGEYNCWGFTAYCMGWLDCVDWLEEDEIKSYLKKYAKKLTKVKYYKRGDIIALYGSHGYLLHTMVCVGEDSYIHKPGGWELEVSNLARVKEIYSEEAGFNVRKMVVFEAKK